MVTLNKKPWPSPANVDYSNWAEAKQSKKQKSFSFVSSNVGHSTHWNQLQHVSPSFLTIHVTGLHNLYNPSFVWHCKSLTLFIKRFISLDLLSSVHRNEKISIIIFVYYKIGVFLIKCCLWKVKGF